MALLTILNIIYVLVAIAMTAFILVQRGAGAQAGSGFGAGASATVFGARGASNFLTKSTAVLATLFFVLSLGMGIYVSRSGITRGTGEGIMDAVPVETAPAPAPAPATTLEVPAPAAVLAPTTAPTGDVPVAPAKDAAPVEPQRPETTDGEEAEGGGNQ
ncbi:MAG TPA: preprotein translocase subunit SecG [Candidatus Saccharimonadia bacterium]|nr:preprotein translocase subunit SecG [Candidatus Saccharimonadia bacterium]